MRTLSWPGAFWVFFAAFVCTAGGQVSFLPVAITGDAAPGFGGDAKFSQFSCLALADDGRVVFSGQTVGTGISFTNDSGVWGGLPGSLILVARTGNAAQGAGIGVTFNYFNGVNIDSHLSVAFVANLQKPGNPNQVGSLWVAALPPASVPNPAQMVVPDSNHLAGVAILANLESSGCNGEALIHATNILACGVSLSGAGVGDSNNEAILEGAYDNWSLVVQSGSPAPGTSLTFSGLVTDQKALAPDGKVAFKSNEGLWLANAGAIESIALNGGPAPASLFAPGCTYTFVSDLVEINTQDAVAFTAYIDSPGLSNSNNQFVVAGPPGALRTIAQSGEPAPGIPGAVFGGGNPSFDVFDDALLGVDGSVAFVGAYSSTGYDYGLWLAPSAGEPLLIARSGAQAPGTPSGVVFAPANGLQYLSSFYEIYLNAAGQIAFRANLSGPGVGSTNSLGIWLADTNGNVNLIARSGETINAGGVQRQLGTITFGNVGVPALGGPQDGRPVPLNSNGQLLFASTFANSSGQGLFIASSGSGTTETTLTGAISSAGFVIGFPTLAGKNYRVDYTRDLSSTNGWSVLESSVPGTGTLVSVTDTNAPQAQARYYRVVRTD